MQDMVPNSFGTHNNVVTVTESDFEAFAALAVDSVATKHLDDNYYIKHGMLFMNLFALNRQNCTQFYYSTQATKAFSEGCTK